MDADSTYAFATHASLEWKAGVSQVKITPEQSMWMAGFGSRNRPSEGTRQELWAKALALEDANGRKAVLITTDLLGFPQPASNRIRDRIKTEFGLDRSQIILNSSHTHAGPVLAEALVDIYPLDSDQVTLINQYTTQLEDQIVYLTGEALQSLNPARLYAENGVSRFAVNRRNNTESTLHLQSQLNGPVDHAVPVIKVEDRSGHPIAIVFGYACHPTIMNDYRWSGDWPAYAREELEKSYPNTMTLFFQGAGADQNPLPRRSNDNAGLASLAQQYGRSIAASVDRVLQEEMRPLPPLFSAAYSEVILPLHDPPSIEELSQMIVEASGYQNQWAVRMKAVIENNEEIIRNYPYPVQIWQLGDQPIISLGGELVVDYAIQIKRILGPHVFVMGYSNDVMGYIPSIRILREGGYEGDRSQMVYGLPGKWHPDIETLILQEVMTLSRKLNIPIPN